jgi:hypothetical protein
MFKVFQMYVSVSSGYCKSRSECYIHCNGCTCMLQASMPNVSSVSCTRMLQVFQTLVSSVSCVFFYVASVASRCFKVDQDVARVAMMF